MGGLNLKKGTCMPLNPEQSSQPEPQPKPAAENKPAPESSQEEQKPPETKPGEFDEVREMSVGIDVRDEMRQFTGEDPNRRFKPLITEIDRSDEQPPAESEPEKKTDEPPPETKEELKSEEAPKPEPEPKPEDKPAESQKPPVEGEIEVAGRKFKSKDEVVNSYSEAVKTMHKEKFERKQDQRKHELELKRMNNERVYLEKVLQKTMVGIADGSAKPSAENAKDGVTKPDISMEELNDRLQGENPADAVRELVERRLATIEKQQQDSFNQIRKEKEEADSKLVESAIRQNIEDARGSEEMKSFSENQEQFGVWLESLYGKDDFGLAKINQICADPTNMKKMYRTYLKDTYDFSSAIQNARADGEASGSVKEKLTPVQSSTDNPSLAEKKKPKLSPADNDVLHMENALGMDRRSGSFIDKGTGLFR